MQVPRLTIRRLLALLRIIGLALIAWHATTGKPRVETAQSRPTSLIDVAESKIDWKNPVELENTAVLSRYALIFAKIGQVDKTGLAGSFSRAWRLYNKGYYHRAVVGTQVPPKVLMAVTILESGARPDQASPAGAAGISQIMPKVARKLGLIVNAKKDERYHIPKALNASARLLQELYAKFGRWDWAIAGYHMGQPNAEELILQYVIPTQKISAKKIVRGDTRLGPISVTRVMLDSTPERHKEAYTVIRSLDDQSMDYYWKAQGCLKLAELWKNDRVAFRRLEGSYGRKNPDFPRDYRLRDEVYYYKNLLQWERDSDVIAAFKRGELVHVQPDKKAIANYGLQRGETSYYARKQSEKKYFESTRPETVGIAYLIAAYYKGWTGGNSKPLTLTSLTRSVEYLERLSGKGTREMVSCHCLGYSFDLSPKEVNTAKLERVLWHLRYMGLIAWKHESPGSANEHYHVTVLPKGTETGKIVWHAVTHEGIPPTPKPHWQQFLLEKWQMYSVPAARLLALYLVLASVAWYLLGHEPKMRWDRRWHFRWAFWWPVTIIALSMYALLLGFAQLLHIRKALQFLRRT